MTITEIEKFLEQSEMEVPMREIAFPAEERGTPIIVNTSTSEAEEIARSLGRMLGYNRATVRCVGVSKEIAV